MSPETLYKFEPRIRSACVASLKARAIENVFDADDTSADSPKNRLVVEASGYTRASNHKDIAKNGRAFFNHYTGQVRFIITTKRDTEGTAKHEAYLGAVRSLMDTARAALAVEGYCFLPFTENAGSVTYINEGERDRSELIYDIPLSIPGAFMDYAAAA